MNTLKTNLEDEKKLYKNLNVKQYNAYKKKVKRLPTKKGFVTSTLLNTFN